MVALRTDSRRGKSDTRRDELLRPTLIETLRLLPPHAEVKFSFGRQLGNVSFSQGEEGPSFSFVDHTLYLAPSPWRSFPFKGGERLHSVGPKSLVGTSDIASDSYSLAQKGEPMVYMVSVSALDFRDQEMKVPDRFSSFRE